MGTAMGQFVALATATSDYGLAVSIVLHVSNISILPSYGALWPEV